MKEYYVVIDVKEQVWLPNVKYLYLEIRTPWAFKYTYIHTDVCMHA